MLVLNTRNVAKFGFVTLDITRKNSLYWILNVEIHLDAMDIRIPLNKKIKHCEKKFHKYYEFISCLCMVGRTKQ